jgi:hypothetical protein
MAFKNLKSNKGLFDSLRDKIEKDNKGNNNSDDRFWSPNVDKAGNGFAVIRFLPAPDGEDLPYIKKYNHGFKIGSKWFIENCPTTIGGTCPVCEANNELWDTGLEMNKDIVRKRKRALSYISNILVISDTKHPENEGQVFLFRYGAKIFDKIKRAFTPEFEDETPFNPYDFWEGADFKLKIRNEANYRNYDSSSFVNPKPLFDGEDKMLEALWKKEHSLLALVAPDQFKSHDELKRKFEKVTSNTPPTPRHEEEEEDLPVNQIAWRGKKLEADYEDDIPFEQKKAKKTEDDDSDNLDFYNQLLGE